MISRDAGCTWQTITKSVTGTKIVAGQNNEAFIWNDQGYCRDKDRDPLYFFKENRVEQKPSPLVCLEALVVDPTNPQHLRVAGKSLWMLKAN